MSRLADVGVDMDDVGHTLEDRGVEGFHESFAHVLNALEQRRHASWRRADMDWAGWALFGLMATAALTGVMITAQLAGLTRLDLPLILGTVVTEDPDRARFAGFFIHLGVGQAFALGYAAYVRGPRRRLLVAGCAVGRVARRVAFAVLVPLLPGAHPRMASHRAGRSTRAVLEPPGVFALSYGLQTPLVAVAAHVAYGALLGALLQMR